MVDLIATRSFTYANRRLLPGQDFATKTERDAKLLIAIGKARPRRVPGAIPAPPADLVAKVPELSDTSDISALRSEYHGLTGKRAYHGWDAETLADKIAQAKG